MFKRNTSNPLSNAERELMLKDIWSISIRLIKP